jgi:hypothetical protein
MTTPAIVVAMRLPGAAVGGQVIKGSGQQATGGALWSP